MFVTAMFCAGKPRLGAADDVTRHEVAIPVTFKGKYALQNNVSVFVLGPTTCSFSCLRTANLTTPI